MLPVVIFLISHPRPFQKEPSSVQSVTTLLMLTFSRFSMTTVGGGLTFAQQQQTETLEEFNERMENPGAP